MYRTVTAGSRGVSDGSLIADAVRESGFRIASVISGCAKGVDTLAIDWAARNGIRVERYPANWDKCGKSAGYRRNERMAEAADALIAVWDGVSRGTKHMMDICESKGMPIFVKNLSL